MFISILGAGVLGLPFAFRQSGLSEGVIVMVIIALLNIHCMMLLVRDCADVICHQPSSQARYSCNQLNSIEGTIVIMPDVF